MPKITGQDLLRLARDTKKIEFQGIRLLEGHGKVGVLRPKKLPANATQATGLELQIDQESGVAVALVHYKLVVTYDGPDEEKDPAVTVTAAFGLHYTITKPVSKKGIERALHSAAMMMAWPYWREFVQSMTVRMGLPAFPLPMLTILDAEASDTKEQKEK